MKNECEPFEGWKQPEDEKEERKRERYLCVHDVRVSLCGYVCPRVCPQERERGKKERVRERENENEHELEPSPSSGSLLIKNLFNIPSLSD